MINPELLEKNDQYHQIEPLLTSEEREAWDQDFLTQYVHHTTAIDGNRIDLEGVKMILEKGIVPGKTTLQEIEELGHSKEAFQFMEFLVYKKTPPSEDLIKDIHEKVLPKGGGIYRDHNVFLHGEGFHVPPSFEKVRPKMKNFIIDIGLKEELDPLQKAAWIHAEFVKIHPFPDDNGQVARLLLNSVLLENSFPPIIIKVEDKAEYFNALDEYCTKDNLQVFADFIAKNIQTQLDSFIEKYGYHVK